MAGKQPKIAGEDTLLVELLTEELPPKSLRILADAFAEQLAAEIVRHRLTDRNPGKAVYATPRRLAVLIPEIRSRALESSHSIEGPASSNMKAVEGFARKHKLTPESLERRQTEKGEIVVANFTMPGVHLDAVLAKMIEGVLKRLPIPKLMRWGDGTAEFARPVHGLVMLHGTRVIPGEVLGVSSSNKTLGHRFLASAGIALKRADDYENTLVNKGKVVVGFSDRRKDILGQLENAAGSAAPVVNDALLDEITALVEAPAVYAGEFDSDFLSVPEECLILSMQQHQRYVPLRDKPGGKLLPRFLFVSNIDARDPRGIVHGNERVLRARLADARFFYDQDRRTRLEARVPRLANVVHHNKLGSQLERVERVQLLAGRIAREISADPLLAERAAWLSKADLLTEMVGEFPELQGTMGRYYALHDGEPKEVADAIESHYRPRFAGDALPQGSIASAVALADKLDTLVGIFGIGEAPTGDKDPYALRRSALGIVRILAENKLPLGLDSLIHSAADSLVNLRVRARAATGEILTFIIDRLRSYLRDSGFEANEIEAVVSQEPSRIDLVLPRLKAVQSFKKLPEAEALASANKRIRNILRKSEAADAGFEESLLQESAERVLYDSIRKIETKVNAFIAAGEYQESLSATAALKLSVDTFFDKVLVNAEDPKLRANRHALLKRLESLMNRVADISKLAA